jgi:hypothetical protein
LRRRHRQSGVLHPLIEDAGADRKALEDAGHAVSAERHALVLTDVEDRPGHLGTCQNRACYRGTNRNTAV